MGHMTPEEQAIYNEGERLIPNVTHDINELVRHRSSYLFFREVIARDTQRLNLGRQVTILDVGSGVGHGCATLADLAGATVVGIDPSPECITYANAHYSRSNVSYLCADLETFASNMPEFDYVVSRGVLEHIRKGLELALRTKWRHRLMIDVPYNESAGPNPHHVLCEIKEDHFSGFPNAELFFEDLAGVIYDRKRKPGVPNMVMCVCSAPFLEPAGAGLSFPVSAWRPERTQHAAQAPHRTLRGWLRRLGLTR
jgi:SAM-dependent methyltransferase